MSSFEFEEIEADEVQVSRKVRTKYKHKVWEHGNDPVAYQRYVLALSRNNERFQKLAFGSYDPEANPFVQEIDERINYQIEMETVFLPDFRALVNNDESIEDDLLNEDQNDNNVEYLEL